MCGLRCWVEDDPNLRRRAKLAVRRTRGGKRKGAGRKPTRPEGPGVSHRRRPLLASRFPVHVSLKVRAGLPNLRGPQLRKVVLKCLRRGQERVGFRLIHFSILGRHLHLIVEAVDAGALARGIQGLSVRLARRVNKVLGTTGKVFADRYYARVLKTPTETKNAVAYVINNVRHHESQLAHPRYYLHGQYSHALNVGAMGLVCGILTLRAGSILPAMIVHSLMNSCGAAALSPKQAIDLALKSWMR